MTAKLSETATAPTPAPTLASQTNKSFTTTSTTQTSILLFPNPDVSSLQKGSNKRRYPTRQEREELASSITSVLQQQQHPSTISSNVSVENRKRCIILVGETSHYRSAARAVPTVFDNSSASASSAATATTDLSPPQHIKSTPSAIEIGSSYGHCLDILHDSFNGNVIGIEKSTKAATESIQLFPNLKNKVRVFDCLKEDSKLLSSMNAAVLGVVLDEEEEKEKEEEEETTTTDLSLSPLSKCCFCHFCCFVDIGGDRHPEAVIQLVEGEALQKVPVVVVKARMLYNRAATLAVKQIGETKEEEKENVALDESKKGKKDVMVQQQQVEEQLNLWWEDIVKKTMEEGDAGLGIPQWARRNDKNGKK